MEKVPEKTSSVTAVYKTLKRRKVLVLVPTILCTVGVAIYSLRLPERYRADVLIATDATAPDPYLTGRTDVTPTTTVQEQLRAIRETLMGPAVLGPVIRELRLYDTSTERDFQKALEATRSRIQIQVEAPDAFRVSFEGDQPVQVTAAANRIANLFVARLASARGEHVAKIDSVLDSEVERLRRSLDEREEGLKSYKQRKVQDLPDRVSANLKLLEDLQQQEQMKTDKVTDLQAQRMAVMEEMQALEKQGALDPEPAEKSAEDTELESLQLKLKQMQSRYTQENPEVQRLQQQIRDLQATKRTPVSHKGPSAVHLRYIGLQADLKSIDQRIQSYQRERAALSSQVAGYESRINAAPGLETDLSERLKDMALVRSQYEMMLARQQAEKLDRKVDRAGDRRMAFRIAEPAQLPDAPYSPKRARLVLFALLTSMGMGLGLVFVIEQMDTSFDTVEEFQNYTNLPVLSAIPGISSRPSPLGKARTKIHDSGLLSSIKAADENISPEQMQHFQKHRLTVVGDPQSVPAQQYGILTLKVQRWVEQTGGRMLVVTSAAGGEGKSLTALNLAMALADSVDGRVLLIDCDLRRPKVHERLGLEGSKGLSDLMSISDRDIHPYVSKVGSLYVMPGGTRLTDDVCLQSSRRITEIVNRAKREYRLIILDSPPIVPIADSHFLADLSDGVLLVVRARQTKRELFRRAVESVESTNILGVVLNDVEYGDTSYAYAYRYYQRHYLGRH